MLRVLNNNTDKTYFTFYKILQFFGHVENNGYYREYQDNKNESPDELSDDIEINNFQLESGRELWYLFLFPRLKCIIFDMFSGFFYEP